MAGVSSGCESALDPAAERPLQADLDLHDPPQLTRPHEFELAQPLDVTPARTIDLALMCERSRHPRQVRDRSDIRPQPLADVLTGGRPTQILVAAARPRRLGDELQLPRPRAQPDHPLPGERLFVQREAPPVNPSGLQVLER